MDSNKKKLGNRTSARFQLVSVSFQIFLKSRCSVDFAHEIVFYINVKNYQLPTGLERTISFVIVRQGETYSEDSRASSQDPEDYKANNFRR